MSNKELGGLPSDGRQEGDYKTKYPPEVIKRQRCEALYIIGLMFVAFAIIVFAFISYNLSSASSNSAYLGLRGESFSVFVKMIYCTFAGLLGGATYDMKCLYRAIASRKWNEDRAFWRFLSPLVSIALAFVMGAIFSDQIINSGFFAISLGFFSGYFSDEAVGKMYDVALVLFSRVNAEEKEDKEHKDSVGKASESDTSEK